MSEKKRVNIRYNLKIFWGLLKGYRLGVLIALICILLYETTFVIDKYLFKVVVDEGSKFAAKEITQQAMNALFTSTALMFVGVLIARVLFKWVSSTIVIKISAAVMYDLKQKFFNHIIKLDYQFFTSHKTGALLSRLGRGSAAVDTMSDTLVFYIAPLVLQTVAVGGSIAYFSPATAMVAFAVIIVFSSYSLYLQLLREPFLLEENEKADAEQAKTSDIFTNIEAVKFFGKESWMGKVYEGLTRATKDAGLRSWAYWKYMDIGHVAILGLGSFGMIFVPLWQFTKGELTMGTLIFAYSAYMNLMGPMFMFVYGIRNFYRAMADFDALFAYGKIEPEVKDHPNAKSLKISRGALELRDVSFMYGKRQVFDGFNLKVPAHKKVAFVGHSGSGKSTLVKLLYRLYDVHGGEILLDGKNVKSFKQESLRSELSIVPQDCVLFDDTIYNNIAFSNPNASRADVFRAIKFAQLDMLVKELPQKEQTIVGERGIKLSGGERQRVSIARAILADKKILILDEATSSLDSETEHAIQKALHELMKGRTSLIIAHRLSTIMSADLIVVLKKGKVVQQGTHNQLIKQEGEYKKLWSLQKGGYIK